MSGFQNQNNIGDQIKDALADALQNGDFKNLNDLVTQTVTDTLNEVGKQIADAVPSQEDISDWKQRAEEWKKQEQAQKERQRRQQEEFRREEQLRREEARRREEQFRREEEHRQQEQFRQQEKSRREEARRRKEQLRHQEEGRRQEQFRYQKQFTGQPVSGSPNVPAVRREKPGRVSGILYQVFGGIGLGFSGLAMMGRLFFLMIGVSGSLSGFLINLAFLAGFAGMIGAGAGKLKRLKRADRYIALCGQKMYEDIEKLAKETGRSVSFVRRDIRKMLKAGIFPEGHLDEQKTCFMLSDAVYGQYQEAEKSRRLREEEAKKAATSSSEPPEKEPDSKPEENSSENELNAMIAEGMDCIRRLRKLNDNIEGEVISDKLFRLEDLLTEIFDSVREHPEQMHRMHKLMDYYLPTTLKLVEAYEEFDGISVPGEEVVQAKAEIEKTLDTINEAFAELLNNLFQDAVFDATTDAQVLKSMLAREGLTKEMEFSGRRRDEPGTDQSGGRGNEPGTDQSGGAEK